MTEPNSQNKKPREERQYNQEQFELLNRCNAEKDMSAWNQWREENPREVVLLEGASLWSAYLKGVDLRGANLIGADLRHANLEGARLQGSILWEAKLKGANLRECCLRETKLMRSHLQGAEFGGANLEGADFSRAIVDGETLFWRCVFDKKTKFEGVALGQMRIYPKEKEAFEYNIRRMNWEDWYWRNQDRKIFKTMKTKKEALVRACRVVSRLILTSPVRLFWSFSDYGRSTGRIAGWFFILAFLFAAIYSNMAHWFPPGIVSNLEIEPHLPSWHYGILVFLRPIYFSVVTMTTLGFGDMYANSQSIWGHILLTIQVILGYVLLGALVTRFAVLFTAGGPAGKFSD